jgi:Ser/Thr protein kinase RdoA (MazF antagonist)
MMSGSLGEKIGEGAFADVHAWAPGRVVKLFKAGIARRTVRHEAHMTRVAFAAGAPAPEAFEEVTLEGRFGYVMARLEGPTLRDLLRSGAVTSLEAGTILATLGMTIHRTPPPPEVLFLRDWMDHSMRGAGDRIPEHIAAGVLRLIERLPPGDGLCHCDLHPGNVIMTADGPRLLDWLGLVRAGPALDLAVCHFNLTELAPARADDPERPRRLDAAVQSEYARLAGMSAVELAAAMERYLPVVWVFSLLGPALRAGEREGMMRRVEAVLRAEELI